MNTNQPDRLDRIEALVESNSCAIEALTSGMVELRSAVRELTDDVAVTQRQLRDALPRIVDHTADIRELQLENKRILRFLEEQTKFYQSQQKHP